MMEGKEMLDFIRQNFTGATVTVAITGLPITLTGEVINSNDCNVLGLRLECGTKVYINANLIALVF